MKILLRATNWVGDVVMSVPALASLRASFPEAHISVLCRPWVADLYRLRPEADEVIVEKPAAEHAGISGKNALAAELRSHGFDRAVILPVSFNAAYTIFKAGVPVRIGYRSEFRSPLLTLALRKPGPSSGHEIFRHLRLAAAAGAAPLDPPDISWEVGRPLREAASKILRQAGWDGAPFLAAHAASFAHEAKRWPAASFREVFERAGSELGLTTVVLLGSAKETPLNSELQGAATAVRVLDVSGKTSLPEVLGILALARGFVGNDSGLAHLAATAGTPTVVIFGPTNPDATRPWDGPRKDGRPARVSIVRKRVLCAPCRFKRCPIDHACMTRILPDDVLFSLRDLLAREEPAEGTA